MTSPSKILLGEVNCRGITHGSEGGGEIRFENPRELEEFEDKAEAVLVVLEPDQNPREVAELILWALRSAGCTKTAVPYRRTRGFSSFERVFRACVPS